MQLSTIPPEDGKELAVRALTLHELKAPLRLEERRPLEPSEGQAVVRLRAAALNRRDYWITQGMYPGIRMPVILGSDGAGIVAKTGVGVSPNWSAKEVIINPGWDWGDNAAAQSGNFRILGMPDDGTFADEVSIPTTCLHRKPAHLNWHESAALPLGGLTAYRAVFAQGQVKAGDNVLVTGIGGGVATFALQFAKATGANVFVTSSSPDKLERARDLRATAGYDYTADGWAKQLQSDHGPMNLIIDSAGGDGYACLIDLAAPGGRIVNYGATTGPPKKLDLFKVFWNQLHLIGTTMGSPDDFANMLAFINDHQIHPALDQVFPLAEGNAALDRMRDSMQFGKMVLQM
ncbi:MAG: alcohol dehydrogenase [Planctomycetaceae bacterium]|nr:alcohol dehydrogenase [Planctomycetaceae bacterium]